MLLIEAAFFCHYPRFFLPDDEHVEAQKVEMRNSERSDPHI